MTTISSSSTSYALSNYTGTTIKALSKLLWQPLLGDRLTKGNSLENNIRDNAKQILIGQRIGRINWRMDRGY